MYCSLPLEIVEVLVVLLVLLFPVGWLLFSLLLELGLWYVVVIMLAGDNAAGGRIDLLLLPEPEGLPRAVDLLLPEAAAMTSSRALQ